MIILMFVCLVLAQISAVLGRENYTFPCTRNSPVFKECLKSALQWIVPKICQDGLPEYGLDSIDPLQVPEMVFNYESLKDIGGKVTVNNTVLEGLINTTIFRLRSVLVNERIFSLDVDFYIPRIAFGGDFVMNGRVSLFPVSGKGPYNITTSQIKGTWVLRGVPVRLGGLKYLRITRFGMKPTLGTFKLHADNIVKGNPKLSQMVVAFTNRFWSLLHYQTLPIFEKNFEEFGKNILNRVLLQIPYDELFPVD